MTRVTRRGLLRTGAAASVLAASGLSVRAQSRGGTLRLGLSGASARDSWDPRRHSGAFMIAAAQGCVFDCLTEITATGELVGELAESWEASADARVWTITLRRGITFHDGSPFGADDVIASLALHRDRDAGSGAWPIVANITEMEKLTVHQVRLTLGAGNADFPFLLSDFHLVMFPAHDIEGAIARGVGTGLYRLDTFEPGRRMTARRVDGHYKDGRAGWFDSVEMTALNDGGARMSALLSGTVDAVNRVDFRHGARLRARRDLEILEVTGNQHIGLPISGGLPPCRGMALQQALKLVVDREDIVANVLGGRGSVARDHPIGPANQYFDAALPPCAHDPDRAAAIVARAGIDGFAIDLEASDDAFPGAVDAAMRLCDAARRAGLDIRVSEARADSVEAVAGWRVMTCAGRATEDWMFSALYQRGAPWNVTGWESDRFQKRLVEARAEFDSARRREIYVEMQAICAEAGHMVIPAYANHVDARSSALAHEARTGNSFGLDGMRLAERWWFA